jgi:hypothetical protein
MSAHAIQHSDLRVMIADAPQPFTFLGQEYTGMISGQTKRRRLEIGGFDDEPEMTLVINLRGVDNEPLFVTLPQVGQVVTVGITNYRIDRTEIDPFNVAFEMDLRSVNK